MPPVRMKGDGRKAKNPKKTILRLLSYLEQHKVTLVVVVLCIIASTVAQTMSSKSLGTLVDDYITPLLSQDSPNYQPLILYLMGMAGLYLLGIVTAFAYNFLMAKVGQGAQKTIRDQMFCHMQTLPIRYFDTHPVGDIMSRYTSDVDTLRQMLSQSIPQFISSATTLIVTFVVMLITSPILTGVLLLTVTGILFVTKFVVGKSAVFFIGQQKSLGKVNSYVEEMIHGQRVVKVFCHEEISKNEFDELNETLRNNSFRAGAYANVMGPVNNNLGYIQYTILCIVGGLIAIASRGTLLSIGKLLSFLLLSRTFNQPISHLSNQINAIVMALAGAERIFDLLDEEPETDEGYVTLVNAKIDSEAILPSARSTPATGPGSIPTRTAPSPTPN